MTFPWCYDRSWPVLPCCSPSPPQVENILIENLESLSSLVPPTLWLLLHSKLSLPFPSSKIGGYACHYGDGCSEHLSNTSALLTFMHVGQLNNLTTQMTESQSQGTGAKL
jgi:hypothetical protein